MAKLIDEEREGLKLSDQEDNSTEKVEWMSLDDAEKNLKFGDERKILKKVMNLTLRP
ncbi:hypothetical protein GF389_03300 [Candidatus Dojkabacteria bacterium]|nr:hypothetical protein [Candidatus Dojkabacteria bacterium]